MELPRETEDYIRESIDHTVGLPVSEQTLLHKLHAVETAQLNLRRQYLALQSKIKEKDDVIERTRAGSSMNAVALKKFVEENQRLAAQCSDLLDTCSKWEREVALYHRDRETLMDFADEVDEKARAAENRVGELEEENKKLAEELQFYKSKSDELLLKDGVSSNDLEEEKELLDSLLTTIFSQKEITTTVAHGFLEAHSGEEVCERLLKVWSSLSPSTQKIVALASEVTRLEKEKGALSTNLRIAEDEVNILSEYNKKLEKVNKRLIKQCYTEKSSDSCSGGKHRSSDSRKGKRKSSSQMTSPVKEKKVDFTDDADSSSNRLPLSPLQPNSCA